MIDIKPSISGKSNYATTLAIKDALTELDTKVSSSELINAPLASQAEAEAGTEATKTMTPLRTAQAIASLGGGGGASYTITKGRSGNDAAQSLVFAADGLLPFCGEYDGGTNDDGFVISIPKPSELGDGGYSNIHIDFSMSGMEFGGDHDDYVRVDIRLAVTSDGSIIENDCQFSIISGFMDYDLNPLRFSIRTLGNGYLIYINEITTSGGYARSIGRINRIEYSSVDEYNVYDPAKIETMLANVDNLMYVSGNSVATFYTSIKCVGYIGAGSTANRPTFNLTEGTRYYDRTLKAYIHYDGTAWVEPASGGGGGAWEIIEQVSPVEGATSWQFGQLYDYSALGYKKVRFIGHIKTTADITALKFVFLGSNQSASRKSAQYKTVEVGTADLDTVVPTLLLDDTTSHIYLATNLSLVDSYPVAVDMEFTLGGNFRCVHFQTMGSDAFNRYMTVSKGVIFSHPQITLDKEGGGNFSAESVITIIGVK